MKHRRPRISAPDIFLGLLLLGAAIYIFYRISIGLHYHWKWELIPRYLFRYDPEKKQWVANLIMQGFFMTLRISIWATAGAMILGTVMGFFRTGPSMFRRLLGGTYVELIRNLPPLVLIFIFWFFVSDQIIPLLGVEDFIRTRSETAQAVLGFIFAPASQFAAFLSGVVSLAVFEGAYITEIVRAGIQSVEKGQWEASAALGFTRWQQMRHIILPQALQRILPALAGQFISVIKDSSIVSVISVQELTFQGMELVASTYLTFEIWITVTLLYLMLTLSCSLIVERFELHLRQNQG
ncbi:MAG: amino acid ABC transporter permease [Desulfococcaceae bacterium]